VPSTQVRSNIIVFAFIPNSNADVTSSFF